MTFSEIHSHFSLSLLYIFPNEKQRIFSICWYSNTPASANTGERVSQLFISNICQRSFSSAVPRSPLVQYGSSHRARLSVVHECLSYQRQPQLNARRYSSLSGAHKVTAVSMSQQSLSFTPDSCHLGTPSFSQSEPFPHLLVEFPQGRETLPTHGFSPRCFIYIFLSL